jgi:hypothetical protein
MGFHQPCRVGGPGECDCLAVLPPVRSPARASALARTTSGSRRSGGRTSCHGRSRRALGRWIRIRCTVSHLPGQSPISWGPVAGSPAPLARLFWERYEGRPLRGVTQMCLPGGMSPRGDRSPEGATPPCRGRCAGLTCLRRAVAAPLTPQTARAMPWMARSRPSASAMVRFVAFAWKPGNEGLQSDRAGRQREQRLHHRGPLGR